MISRSLNKRIDSHGARHSRVRLLLRTSLIVTLIVGPGVLIVLWLLFHHKPTWYQPAGPTQQTVHQAQASLANVADQISDQMVQGEPFQIRIGSGAMNDWLAAAPSLHPKFAKALPSVISGLAVGIDDGAVRIGGLAKTKDWQTIFSISIHATVSQTGKEILLRIGDVRMGSLTMPGPFLRKLIDDHRNDSRFRRMLDAASRFTLARVETIAEFFTGIRIANWFVWPNGERPFRIEWIGVEGDAVLIRFHPLS